MKYIRNYKTTDDYNAEKDMLVKPNISSVIEDNSIHYNEDYFECTIETLSAFKIFIYFNKTDYDNREPSYVFKGLAGINSVKFNHKIYNIEFLIKVGNSAYMNNNNIISIIAKGDIEYPIGLCAFTSNHNAVNVDISKLNPYSFNSLELMFLGYNRYNKNNPILDVTGFCKKNVTSLANTFNYNLYLSHLIGLSGWDVSNCKSLKQLFNRTNMLDNINDINNWDTSKNESLYGTFSQLSTPDNTINVGGLNTKLVKTLYNVFYISTITSIFGLENWDVSNCLDFTRAFCYLEAKAVLQYINVSTWNMKNADNLSNMFWDFAGSTLDLSKWSLPKATNLSGILCNAFNLETLDVHNWNPINNKSLFLAFARNGNSSADIFIMKTKHIDIHGWDNNELLDMSGTFQMLGFLEDINMSGFKTPKVTSMAYIFNKCSIIKELDLSSMITKYVTSLKGAFAECLGLIKLNISNFDNTSLVDMTDMFKNCNSLTQLILGRNFFNSASITNYIFKDLTNWTESSSLATFVDALPITITQKTLTLSPATNNALTSNQKGQINDKNWLITVQ